MIEQANEMLSGIDSMEVCKEVIESRQGSDFLLSATEVYRVASRIKTAMQAFCKYGTLFTCIHVL